MIQLKPGLQPSSLNNPPDAKRRKGAKSQGMGSKGKRNAEGTAAKGRGLRFERVFSDA